MGEPAVGQLCDLLEHRRDSETRIAAAVDALVASRGDVDVAVSRLAQSETAAVLCDAAQILGRRRSTAAVPRLAALSTHADDNVALAAIEALGRIGDDDAITPLIAAVESRSFFRTFPAIDVLGRTGSPRAAKALFALLDEPPYASEAVRALGRMGEPSAIGPLTALLTRANDGMVRTVATALAEIDDRSVERFGNASAIGATLSRDEFRRTTRRIVQALSQADAVEESALCRVLGWIGGEASILALVDLLSTERSAAPTAAEALGRLGKAASPVLLAALLGADSERRLMILPLIGHSADAVPALVECLGDLNPSVRSLACDALARVGQTEVVPRLFALLGEGDARVAQSAIAAIQSLGSPLTERLATEAAKSSDARVRRAGLRIVAYFGYASAIDVLVDAMEDGDERIRDAAIFGLPFIETPGATEALLRASAHPSSRTRAAAMRAIGQAAGESRMLVALRTGLHDPDPWVRYFACQALSRRRDEEAAEMISALLADPAGQVRVAAIEALAQLRGVHALDALHAAAVGADADVRRAALLGLGHVKDPSSMPVLLKAVEGDDPATRLVALSALAGYDGPAIAHALGERLMDGDESVRRATAALLGSRGGADATRVLLAHVANRPMQAAIVAALAQPAEGRIEVLSDELRGASAVTAPLIVSALARSQRPETARVLEEAFSSDDPVIRRAVAPALAAMSTRSARALLAHAAANDPDEEVRQISAAAAAK
jgi:HEAT repeat protein